MRIDSKRPAPDALDGERMQAERTETERTTGVQSHNTKNNRLTKDAQTASGQCYTETDQLHRKREAQARIRRTREQRHAAKYFYGLQRGCVRRV